MGAAYGIRGRGRKDTRTLESLNQQNQEIQETGCQTGLKQEGSLP